MLEKARKFLRLHRPLRTSYAAQETGRASVHEQAARNHDPQSRQRRASRTGQFDAVDRSVERGVQRVFDDLGHEPLDDVELLQRYACHFAGSVADPENECSTARVSEGGHLVSQRVPLWSPDLLAGKNDLLEFERFIFAEANSVQQVER